MLSDIWPTDDEINETLLNSLTPDMFRERYSDVLKSLGGILFLPKIGIVSLGRQSTYIRLPHFSKGIEASFSPIRPIKDARVLLKLGDSVTTDHISPAGVSHHGPAGKYLIENGVS